MIRKQILSSVTIAAFAAILLAWAPSTAYAGADNSATVIRDFGCFVNIGGHFGSTSEMTHSVTNNNKLVLTCHFTGVTNPPAEDAEVFKGFLCGTFAGVTANTFFVATPSGNGMLRCIVDL